MRLRIAVGLATAGRPAIVGETLMRIARQTRPPDVVLVCAPTEADVSRDVLASGRPDFPATEILFGARGLTRQRNAILDRLPDADIICFFDDDFVPDRDYLAALERAFLQDQTLVGATGAVIADGITGPGYSFAEADALLAQRSRTDTAAATPVYNAYGCNMAFRLRQIRAANLRFDERLPRYGWLEDVDFSRRAARFGTLARIEGAVGVHLGTKGGRQSGLCFGYSQIANPVHLVRKGSYAWPRAAWLMSRNLGMNLVRASRPEPHIDRRGRVAGNFAALRDFLRGRLDPERIEGLS
ncbi:glycosyltransferase family 2 protein [Methylobacterium sp. BTF04]|nr:glycosyltransferase family 2 protein [Methylobacterium sp. BTF04]